MEEKYLDLKNQEGKTEGDQSTPEEKTSPKSTEDLQNSEEKSADETADRLLKDGTSADKKISVNKKSFDDKNEKAKLYETHAPLLDKVLKNPELVEQLLETEEKGDLGTRLEALEEERKTEKRKELRDAVVESVSRWPDFDKSWSEVQPIVESLVKQGASYREAMRRGYLAVNPEAAQAEATRMAREGENALGKFSTGGSAPTRVSQFKEEPKLTDGERHIARVLGKSEADYAKMMETHKGWLKEKGFYDVE